MRRFSLILLSALILSSIVLSTNAEQSKEKKGTDIPCFNDGVLGDWVQKDCLAREIPGFAGYMSIDCILAVYLTTFDQIEKARAILEPLYGKSRYAKIECKSGTHVLIRKVRYSWTQLREWTGNSPLVDKMRELPGFITANINEETNSVDLLFKDDSEFARAKNIITSLQLPQDAFNMISEAERAKPHLAQIRDGDLLVPAFISEDNIGILVLGKTTLAQTQNMFPASPSGYEGTPRRPDGYPVSKVGEVSPKPNLVFLPYMSNYALYYDKNERLVIVKDFIPPLKGQTVAEVSKMYPGLRKTDSFDGNYEMQTELTPCAVLMLMVNEDDNEISMSAYAYTCKTER